jgi:ABC-type nitrate/sulfonate/bicarbonate transport system permease component
MSLWRAFCGFSIGAPLALISGAFIGLKKVGDDFLEPPIELLRSIPPMSMISVALLWFGIGFKLSVFIIAWAIFFPIYINTVAGFKKTDRRYIQAARTLGAKQTDLILKVILPQAMPMIFAGLRLSLSTSLSDCRAFGGRNDICKIDSLGPAYMQQPKALLLLERK